MLTNRELEITRHSTCLRFDCEDETFLRYQVVVEIDPTMPYADRIVIHGSRITPPGFLGDRSKDFDRWEEEARLEPGSRIASLITDTVRNVQRLMGEGRMSRGARITDFPVRPFVEVLKEEYSDDASIGEMVRGLSV